MKGTTMKASRTCAIVCAPLLAFAAMAGCKNKVTLELETQEDAGELSPARAARLDGVNAGPFHVDLGRATVDPATVQQAGSEYNALGVTTVRTHDNQFTLDIDDLYTDTPTYAASPAAETSYNWESSDKQFQAIVDAGMSVYLRIGGSSTDGTGFLPSIPGDTEQWGNFVDVCEHIVAHYVDGWKTNGDEEPYTGPIAGVEIWNEHTNSKFWSLGDGAFVDLYVELLERLNARYPGLAVGGPGFGWGELFASPTADTDGDGVPDVLRGFVDAVVAEDEYMGREHRRPAFLSWHIYSRSANDYKHAAGVVQDEIERFKDELNARLEPHETGVQLMESHVSEWNTAAEKDPERGTGVACAQLTGGWIELQRAGVHRAMFHRGWDEAELDKPGGYGLIAYDDDPAASKQLKPIAHAFRLWADFIQEAGEFLHATPNKSKDGLHFLAQTTATGEIMVILANSGDDELKYHIDLPGAAGKVDAAAMTIDEIDADGNLTEGMTPSGTPVDLPPDTVHLVRISG